MRTVRPASVTRGAGRAGPAIRGGFILPVVLVLIGLLALMAAGFLFFTRAELAGTVALADGHQARLAAESGFEELVAMLRTSRDNPDEWWDNPKRLRHALVWARDYKRDADPVRESGNREKILEQATAIPAWRFSVCAPNLDGPQDTFRYGVTPESSKLNLNACRPEQIEQLLTPLLLGLQIENPQELINALLDWVDADSDLTLGGAESEYYNTLTPPYNAKNGPLDTLEEMLLIRGFSARVLYGEDVNLNGILDANEDDGEASFPYDDDGDGVLDLGIIPFVTLWSREPDTALDNKPRISLRLPAAAFSAALAATLTEGELTETALAYLTQLKTQEVDLSGLRSAADLLPADETGDGDSTGDTEGERPPTSQPAAGRGRGRGPALPPSPLTPVDMPGIMDRFTAREVSQNSPPLVAGLINLNTAPAQVLRLIPGITDDTVTKIVELRRELPYESRKTTAWPLVSGAADVATFQRIAPYVTTKSYQFRIEVLGYGDHAKLARRLEWIVEMAGPLAQVKYHRELTGLGRAWPIDDDNYLITAGR